MLLVYIDFCDFFNNHFWSAIEEFLPPTMLPVSILPNPRYLLYPNPNQVKQGNKAPNAPSVDKLFYL